MIELNYKKANYEELIKLIKDCRKELFDRGILTEFRVLFIKRMNKKRLEKLEKELK